MMRDDGLFMSRAVALAWKGLHHVEPHPMVGAVFVRGEEILGEGYHRAFGEDHAEVEAFSDALQRGNSLVGSTLYVTLEPCCHTGKRPPCTEKLLSLGLERVVYGQRDPNPIVCGKGAMILEKAGIHVQELPVDSVRELNSVYFKNTLFQLPFVHLKSACTLDGKLTLQKGKSASLSGPESQLRVHGLRDRYDAILVGIGTVEIDDPQLTARIPGGVNPIRIILDSHLRISSESRLLHSGGLTLIATVSSQIHPPFWESKNVEILLCKPDAEGRIDLRDLLEKLFKRGIRSVLIEGGEGVNTSFLKEDLVDRISFILTPHVSQELDSPSVFDSKQILPLAFQQGQFQKIGNDLWFEAEVGGWHFP